MSYNSTIFKKKCKCGCENFPTMSYEGYYMPHAPQEVLDRLDKKQKRNNAAKLGNTKLRNLSKSDVDVNAPKWYKSKSELLREADRAFSGYIKGRDIGTKSGTAYCPCCDKVFDSRVVEVNCMHFVDRDVYSLRFDENNAHIGHATCNRNQHYSPKGIEYINFRKHLVKNLGEEEVAEMELAHRKINRIEASQLKTVIEHYGINNG